MEIIQKTQKLIIKYPIGLRKCYVFTFKLPAEWGKYILQKESTECHSFVLLVLTSYKNYLTQNRMHLERHAHITELGKIVFRNWSIEWK
jgi:hypothetical protein